MIKKIESLGDLETGIKQLLLENRCSFSDEEKVILKNCLLLIRQAKRNQTTNNIVRVIETLSRFFLTNDSFNDFF
jgi:hypothetical protein